jgi:peptide-methionine (S)-S-oxide reductase
MHPQRLILLAAVLIAVGFVWLRGGFVGLLERPFAVATEVTAPPREGLAIATFASGCFWSTESDFDKVPGVVATTVGYTGGRVHNPTYRQVSAGRTGHAEAVEVTYDPAVVTYEQLLDAYWRHVDPFTAHRQFCDIGSHYRPEIFVHSEAQRAAAESSKAAVQRRFWAPIVVRITPAGPFYRAEEYHQDYHQKHATQYRFYRSGCGRDRRLAEIWGS